MKKLLVLAVLFLGGITAQANQVTDLDHGQKKGIRYNQAQPITFVQKGIQFFVYTDGDFDFQLIRSNNRGRRGTQYLNAPGSTFGVNYPYNTSRLVRYDYWGNINKIGRNHIFYNRNGRVNHIGNTTMRYRNGRLARIGNMTVIYDLRGRISRLQGQIHHNHTACGICGISGCSTNHFDYGNHQGQHGNSHQDWNYNWGTNDLEHFGRRDAKSKKFKVTNTRQRGKKRN
jgi:hypothetical protein